MAFFKYALRAPSFALCVAILASCGGNRDNDTPDAAPDGASTAGASGSGGAGGSGGKGGTAGTTSTGGAAGKGGSGGNSGSATDGGPADVNRGGAAGTGIDVRVDTPSDTVSADVPRDTGSDSAGSCTSDTQCSTGHCVGGVCCATACTTPGTCEKADGATCTDGTTCKYLKAADDSACDDGDACTNNVCFNGSCVVKSPKDCNDSDQCTTDTCTPSTGACVHTPLSCDDANPCTTDTCGATTGCQHSDNNAAACTDGNACTDDVCSGGLCVSTPKNCSSLSNDCNTGVCVNGTCQAQPANANGSCDEGLVSCDATGKCDSAGHCVGNHDACGALATTCVACTNEAGCFNGRLCTCQVATPPVVLQNGKCVTSLDECTTNPCVAGATCNDPTPNAPASGDVVCTCPAGYQGNGKVSGTGCTDIDECTTNPCGAGATACNGSSPPGSYTCTCGPGFTAISTSTGPTCVCDLSGTYGLSIKTKVGWDAVVVLGTKALEESPAGGVEVYRWGLRHQKIETNGSLTVTNIPCGGTAPDACDLAYQRAHAQYQPNHIWGKAKINAGAQGATVSSLQGVVPGGTYTEAATALLLGISLTDPLGEWPACRACVGVNAGSTCSCSDGMHTVTNKATWVDVDDDSNLGITNLHIPRGGLGIDNTPPDPPYVYTEPTSCPRLAATPGGYTYEEWPGVTGITPFRTNKWYVGSRMTSGLTSTSITLVSNACSITGNVTGPVSGKTRSEQRIQGCQKCSDGNSAACVVGNECNDAEIDFYDNQAQTQRVESETFSLTKMSNIDVGAIIAMPDGASKDQAFNNACKEMRLATCPAGKTCTGP